MKKIIEPTVDFCAKEIFENEVVRRYFLSAFLSLPIEEIKDTQIINPYLRRWSKKGKDGILDVIIKLQDGKHINIEIQVKIQEDWDKRSVYYLSRLFVQGLDKGQQYEELKQCVNISILDFNYLSTPDSHTVFRFRDKQGNDYTNVMEIHIVELPKLQSEKAVFNERECIQNIEEDTKMEYESQVQEWIRFFKCKSEEDVMMLKQQTRNPGIKEAITALLSINHSPNIRARYEARQKKARDQYAREKYVKNQGIEQGIEQGIRAFIAAALEWNIKQEDIIEKMENKFHITNEQAVKYYQVYQNERIGRINEQK